MNPDTPRYEFRDKEQAVYAVFWVRGPAGSRRHYRKLCSYAVAHLDAYGKLLPGRTDAEQDAFLLPLWREARDALAAQEAQGGTQTPRFKALSDEWLLDVEARRSARTAEMYRHSRDRWLRLMRDGPLEVIKRADLRKYIGKLKAERGRGGKLLSLTTVNVDLKHLRAFLRWAEEELHDRDLDFRPPRIHLEPVPLLRVHHPPDTALTAAWRELTWRIIRGRNGIPHRRHPQAEPRKLRPYDVLSAICLRRLLVLDTATGLRRAELISRMVADVDLESHGVHIGAHEGFRVKEGQDKFASWTPAISAFLREDLALTAPAAWLFPGMPDDEGERGALWTDPHSATSAMRQLWAEVGYADRAWKPIHGNRARVITTLMEAGATDHDAALIAGHRQVTTTQGYVTRHVARKQRVLGLADLVQPFGISPTASSTASAEILT